MNQKTLPFIISIPHSGMKVPRELNKHTIIVQHDLFNDCDSFTREIYDVGDLVQNVITTNTARAFVDLNRPPEIDTSNPDGVIKTQTCLAKLIYKDSMHPDRHLRNQLIKRYYSPYHRELKIWNNNKNIKFGFDCHSMLPEAPLISPDRGRQRPLISLGNLEGRTCPEKNIIILAKIFQNIFKLKRNDIEINYPFKGGYIIKKYGNNPIPWIQIELNRSLYLNNNWFDYDSLKIDDSRLFELNLLFREVLKTFNQEVSV